MKHTPGPWKVWKEDSGAIEILHGNLAIAGMYFTGYPADTEANAHLIASASVLLEACREALKVLVYPSAISEKAIRGTYDIVRAAIAAAEGGEP